MRVLLLFAVMAAATPAHAAEPTTAEVQAGVKKGVVFGIRPDADGKAASCEYSMTQDGATNMPDPNFHPSDAYVADACQKLALRKWPVSVDKSGKIDRVYDFCMWSEVVPNSAICRVVPGG